MTRARIFYRILSIPLHDTLPSTPPPPLLNVSVEYTSRWALFPKAFLSEEGNLLFIGLFLLRFSYGLIFTCLNDLILLTSLVN